MCSMWAPIAAAAPSASPAATWSKIASCSATIAVEAACPAGRGHALDEDHVAQAVDVVGQAPIARGGKEHVVEATVVDPQAGFVTGRGSLFHECKLASERLDLGRRHPGDRLCRGRQLEHQPQLEDLLEVVDRGLQDPDAPIALELDHAPGGELDERLADRRSRDSERFRELGDRVETPRHELAGDDRRTHHVQDFLGPRGTRRDRAEAGSRAPTGSGTGCVAAGLGNA